MSRDVSDPAKEKPLSGGTAEDLFVEWLVAQEGGRASSIDALCAAHPQRAEDLRALHADWLQVAPALQRARSEQTVVETLAQRFGSNVDPGISLDVRAAVSGERVAGDLLERLAADHAGGARYELRGEVARGGMGAVLQAWDRDLRRNLAMKVVLGRTALRAPGEPVQLEPRDLSRFLEEAQVTAQLEHPNIVPVHELGVDDVGRAYFTMPLVRGREFKAIIAEVHGADGPEVAQGGAPAERAEPWTLRRALGVVLRVCDAVAYAHSKGVLHRDIKPSNIMVGRFGEVYLMDWGLARVKGRPSPFEPAAPQDPALETERRELADSDPNSTLLTRDGDVVGTPSYMAPEQGRGEAEVLDSRADLYSIGAVLYHLVGGRAPYQDEDERRRAESVLTDLLREPPRPLVELAPQAAPDLIAIVERAMARRPESRYASASELGRDLDRYLANVPVAARRASLGHHLRLGYLRHRTLVNTAAGFLLLLLASWGVYSVRWSTLLGRLQDTDDVLSVGHAALALPDLPVADVRRTGELDAWLASSESLLARRERIVARAGASSEAAAGGSGIRPESLVRQLDELERLRPWVAALRADLERAAARDDAQAWQEVRERVAASALYGDLELPAQPGLVPLGSDPRSGLEEFWLPASGPSPMRLEGADEWWLGGDFGLVFVLLPKGRFRVGLPPTEPEARDTREERELEPFFVSKYELTNGQASRVLPDWRASEEPNVAAVNLDWYECARVASAYGCRLLDSVRWEYAVRSGSDVLYGSPSTDVTEVRARENMRDASYREEQQAGVANPLQTANWYDDNAMNGAVGQFEPTPWGLHDVFGNVSEWCLDDAPSGVASVRYKVRRGGSWASFPTILEMLESKGNLPEYKSRAIGTRLMRPVTP